MSEVTAIGWVPSDDRFPTRLAMLRQRMGWNVKQAADACGVKVQSWRNWEGGGHCRDQEGVARRISEHTGVSFLWLFAGMADRGPTPPRVDGAQTSEATMRRNTACDELTIRRQRRSLTRQAPAHVPAARVAS